MIDLGRYAVRVAVRRVVAIIVLALLAWAGIGRAEASCNSSTGQCSTIQEAWQKVNADDAAYKATDQANGAPYYNTRITGSGTQASPFRQQSCGISQYIDCGNENNWTTNYAYWGTIQCTAPTPDFDKATGQCIDLNSQCLALNEEAGRVNMAGVLETRGYSSQCMKNGCSFGLKPGTGGVTVSGSGMEPMTSGEFVWLGKCSTTPPSTAPDKATEVDVPHDKPMCKQHGSTGVTVCQKPNGEQCFTYATDARMACFGVGETGTKTDGSKAVTRGPGTSEPPPPTPPTGETFDPSKKAGPATTTTTTNTSTTTTTTIINTTTNGTDAGPTNDGEAKDGSDDAAGEGGGGASCSPDAKPWFSGEPGTEALVTQAWATRCAVEWGNAVKVTGDIADCAHPFTVEGGTRAMNGTDGATQQANVEQLKATRKQLCPDGAPEDAVGAEPADAATVKGAVVGEGVTVGSEGLDQTGFGWSRQCPTIEPVDFMGQTITFPMTIFCDWMKLGGQFVLLIVALLSLRYMAGGA